MGVNCLYGQDEDMGQWLSSGLIRGVQIGTWTEGDNTS